MANYLITGGAGFIGSHIADRLIREGHAVRILDDLSSGSKDNLKQVWNKIEFVNGCISDMDTAYQATKDMDYVLHQAALRSVPKSVDCPMEFNKINIEGTLNLLIASRDNKVGKFAFASSSSVYGNTNKFPQKETERPQPVSPYAITKITGEYYCKSFSGIYDFNTVSIRYFNVFGPRQSLENQYAVVIPKFISCILNNEQPPIHGDGKQSRDFTYVDNVVDGILTACNKTIKKGEVYNIACGQEHSLLDLVYEINKILHTDIQPRFLGLRPGDVPRTLADISKAEKQLHWKPIVDFHEGLEKTVTWFKEHRIS